MLLAIGCNLRQMGDSNHLPALSHTAEYIRHTRSHAAADTGINLIEDDRRQRRGIGSQCLDRQHDSCHLAAGSHIRYALQRLPEVGGKQEVHHIMTCSRIIRSGGDTDLHVGVCYTQLAQVGYESFGYRLADRQTRLGKRIGSLAHSTERFLFRLGQTLNLLVEMLEHLRLLLQSCLLRQQIAHGAAAELTQQGLDEHQSLLHLFQPLRVGIQTPEQVLRLAGYILELDVTALDALLQLLRRVANVQRMQGLQHRAVVATQSINGFRQTAADLLGV